MRVLFGLLKVLTGISLAIAILFFSGMYAVRYAMTRLTTVPERPVFPEEATTVETSATEIIEDNPDTAAEEPQESGELGDEATVADADLPPETEETTLPDEGLEPGAYRARVVQPIGLILRKGPDTSTIQLGGVAYNEELIVLSESSDGNWINVRLPGSDVEGWVKNGNTEPLDGQD